MAYRRASRSRSNASLLFSRRWTRSHRNRPHCLSMRSGIRSLTSLSRRLRATRPGSSLDMSGSSDSRMVGTSKNEYMNRVSGAMPGGASTEERRIWSSSPHS